MNQPAEVASEVASGLPSSLTAGVAPEIAPSVAQAAVTPPTFLASLIETTKPGITRLVTITAFVGFVMAAVQHAWTFPQLLVAALGCVAGTALSAAGANALNQWLERDRDATMDRTAARPLPQGRLTPRTVFILGASLSAVGVALLWGTVGYIPALLSLACVVVYTLFYTPMKVLTPMATFVGTIPGALPPLIGWTAASSAPGYHALLEWGGLSLFALMTVWQIPHFLAIAWMHKDDYAKGGFCVLPTQRDGEKRTVFTIAVWSVLLLPATLGPGWLIPQLGLPYLIVAGISGSAFLVLAYRLIRERTRPNARNLFLGSIMHLPLLLVAMVAIAIVRVMV